MHSVTGSSSWRRFGLLPLLAIVLSAELLLVGAAALYSQSENLAETARTTLRTFTRRNAALPGRLAGAIASVADLIVLPVAVAAFWYAVPTAPVSNPRAKSKRYAQFRIRSLLAVLGLWGVICACSRGVGLHPLLVLAGMIYCTGPWTALLIGALARLRYPLLEHRVTCGALLVLAALGIGYAFLSTVLDRDYAIGIRELIRITAILWTPQIILCFVLRSLLMPLGSEATGDETSQLPRFSGNNENSLTQHVAESGRIKVRNRIEPS